MKKTMTYPIATEVLDRWRRRCETAEPDGVEKADLLTGLLILCSDYFPDGLYQFLANAGRNPVGYETAKPGLERIGEVVQTVFRELYPEPPGSPAEPAATKLKRKKKDPV